MYLDNMTEEELLASKKIMESNLKISNVISFSKKITDNSFEYFDVFKIRYKQFWKIPKYFKFKRKIIYQKAYNNGDISTHHKQSDDSIFLGFVLSENKIPEIPY